MATRPKDPVRAHRSVTIDDVARAAGVSRATASRVVNDSQKVSSAARVAVVDAVERLGYVPNRAARSLMTRRSGSIGVVIKEPTARLFADPFFGLLLLGISDGLAERDVQLVLLIAPASREEARVEQYIASAHVDGAILIGPHGDDPMPSRLAGTGVPVVLSGRPNVDSSVSFVDSDNRAGARMAVDHLLRSGRRRIATIYGTMDLSSARDRRDGYRDAIRTAGIELQPGLEIAGDYSQDTAAKATQRLLETRPDIDALFAASDSMAAAAVRVLQDAGRRIPEDVAVIGFDDTPIARTTRPTLSTVRQPIEAMGREMARLLLQRIDDPAEAPSHVIFSTELVLRESTPQA